MIQTRPDFLTVKAVRERYGIPTTSLYRLIGSGKVEAVKIGRSTRVSVASLDKLFSTAQRLEVKEQPVQNA